VLCLYVKYDFQDAFCHDNITKKGLKVANFTKIASKDQEGLRLAIFKHGPVSVGIDASHKSLSFYADGVYYETKCGKHWILECFEFKWAHIFIDFGGNK